MAVNSLGATDTNINNDNNDSSSDEADYDLERDHYMEVRFAFLEYSAYMEQEVKRLQDHLHKLAADHLDKICWTMATMCVPREYWRTNFYDNTKKAQHKQNTWPYIMIMSTRSIEFKE